MDIEINELPPVGSIEMADLFPASRDGEAKKVTAQQIADSIIAMLTDSAPAALDTLNELAAALGDDENFAATMLAALSGKLAIASNLADLDDADEALGNLGGGAAGTAVFKAQTTGEVRDQLKVATIAAAIADNPDVDPEYYDIGYRDTNYIAGSGGNYRKQASEPSHALKFQNANSTWYAKEGRIVSLEECGGYSGASDHYAAWQMAYDYLAAVGGGTLTVGDGLWNLLTAPTCSADGVHTDIHHDAVINHDTADYMALKITGARHKVSGGNFIGPEEWDPATGSGTPAYGVIWVTGETFTAIGVKMLNIRRIGIGCKDITNVLIQGCDINGNQPRPTFPLITTFHFGIFLDAGSAASLGNFQVLGNKIRNCTTGLCVANYGSGPANTRSFISSGNTYEGMWDHGEYSNYTGGALITGNTYHRCHGPIACSGPNNIVSNITHYTEETVSPDERDCAATVSMRDPVNCQVRGITIRGHGDSISGQTVIGVDLINVTSTAMNGNIVDGVTMAVMSGQARAVRVNATVAYSHLKICNVNFEGQIKNGSGAVEMTGAACTCPQIDNINVRNTGGAGAFGVYMGRMNGGQVARVNYEVAFNAGSADTQIAVALVDGNDNWVSQVMPRCAGGLGTNITLVGLKEFDAGNGSCSRNALSGMKDVVGGNATYVPVVPVSSTSELAVNDVEVTDGPSFAARAGSMVRRTVAGAGAGSSLYINQGDGSNWVGFLNGV
ncbi:right-handed parallel beta-helix repeat-containing protein [Hoeflea sp. BAL378]|uniref:right-handed parallel beta-helix repeat-containing protein n=1 Tax=Hoeflea sp. BAL378 TaxID=1547437 RepID=UPI000691C20B|nr:right-handed parallel beta-helix repeat-containing protein [Hoeflea sp. BAL378]